MQYADVAKTIDHALLQPTLDRTALEAGLELARCYEVASVCILPYAVGLARRALADSGVKATTVIGFPHGAVSTASKRYEAEQAVGEGAEELDLVVNLSRVHSGEWHAVSADIASVLGVCRAAGAKLKLIFETSALGELQKRELCRIATALEVDWVKTSTGFGSGGATLEDVQLMRSLVPQPIQVKASGGIRDLDGLLAFLPYVTRIGTSHTRAILDELRARLGLPALAGVTANASGGY